MHLNTKERYEFELAEELFENNIGMSVFYGKRNDNAGRTPMTKPVPTRLITVPIEYRTIRTKPSVKITKTRFENHALAKITIAPKVSNIVPRRLSTKPAMELEKEYQQISPRALDHKRGGKLTNQRTHKALLFLKVLKT